MMILLKLFWIVLLFVGVWILFRLVRQVKSIVSPEARSLKKCPACQQLIPVPKGDFECPRCGTKLGHNQQGGLLIRIN